MCPGPTGNNPSISGRTVGFAELGSKRKGSRGEEGKKKTFLNTGETREDRR